MATNSNQSNPGFVQPDPLLQPGSHIDDQDGANASDTVMDDQDFSTPKKEVQETPSWLPEGWRMETKVRGSGLTAGTTDRYYIDPTSRHRLRSKREVEYFLQTGTKKKRTIPTGANPSGTPGAGKRKKPNSGAKKDQPSSFDYEDVPEMVTWKSTGPSNDDWTPFIDGEMVSSSTKQEWDAAAVSLISGSK